MHFPYKKRKYSWYSNIPLNASSDIKKKIQNINLHILLWKLQNIKKKEWNEPIGAYHRHQHLSVFLLWAYRCLPPTSAFISLSPVSSHLTLNSRFCQSHGRQNPSYDIISHIYFIMLQHAQGHTFKNITTMTLSHLTKVKTFCSCHFITTPYSTP